MTSWSGKTEQHSILIYVERVCFLHDCQQLEPSVEEVAPVASTSTAGHVASVAQQVFLDFQMPSIIHRRYRRKNMSTAITTQLEPSAEEVAPVASTSTDDVTAEAPQPSAEEVTMRRLLPLLVMTWLEKHHSQQIMIHRSFR
ncbi:hypothetical protein LSAT2_027817 [Lamellibrachia satsuma]|nr:hypothetical protein LSAT2_027817 [Lamellibrachia satsuma]